MINYRGKPVLGPDSSIKNTSEFFALAGTILFWLLFLIFSFVIKAQPKKPEYKEVQIVLSSTPVVQKSEESPAPAEQAAASAASSQMAVAEAAETPSPAPEPVQKPAAKETSKPAAKKNETSKTNPKPAAKKETQKAAAQPKPAEPVEQVLYQDPMEAFNNQVKKQPKKEFDWSQLEDDDAAESSNSSQTRNVSNKAPAFSGNAGTAASDDNQKVTSSSTSNKPSQSQNASSSTSSALQGIKNSTFKGNATNGVQSETTAKTKNSGTGRVEMEMSNGRSRALIKPASPVINLSPAAAATIDTSKTVTIKFRVVDAGTVPYADITITPESTLATIVRDEIKKQISEWLFEPADYTATATFEYKIVKR